MPQEAVGDEPPLDRNLQRERTMYTDSSFNSVTHDKVPETYKTHVHCFLVKLQVACVLVPSHSDT
jgi:hypothetical protein